MLEPQNQDRNSRNLAVDTFSALLIGAGAAWALTGFATLRNSFLFLTGVGIATALATLISHLRPTTVRDGKCRPVSVAVKRFLALMIDVILISFVVAIVGDSTSTVLYLLGVGTAVVYMLIRNTFVRGVGTMALGMYAECDRSQWTTRVVLSNLIEIVPGLVLAIEVNSDQPLGPTGFVVAAVWIIDFTRALADGRKFSDILLGIHFMETATLSKRDFESDHGPS